MKIKKTKKTKINNSLQKLNFLFAFLILVLNIITFFYIDASKDGFTKISLFFNGLLFFGYLIIFSEKVKKNVIELKKEALYINFPIYIGGLISFILGMLIFSAISLFIINPEAANITFIFTFFVSTVSMLFPSITMIIFMFFIVPAFIIPGLNNKRKNNSNNIFKILFVLYIIYCIFSIVKNLYNITNIQNKEKFKSSILTMKYSSDFLKFKDIGTYTIKLLSRHDVTVPLIYTSETIPFNSQQEAINFCNSMNARVPDYLELYNIVFNKFDTFGNQYYWTSNRDGKYPIVLHYNNMSYHIIRKPENITPVTYCIAKDNTQYGFGAKHFFYRNVKKENIEVKKKNNKGLNIDLFKEISENDKEDINNNVAEEKKYVNFSVKEVSPAYMKLLQDKGYNYNPDVSIKKEFEVSDNKFNSIIRENTNHIRLCFFPFTNYGNLKIKDEQQIWEQSFCSPSFEVIEQTPAIKSRYEKEAYCYAKGGRLPNIPELNGILKTLGKTEPNIKYWTNNKINGANDIIVHYEDFKTMKTDVIMNNEIDSAYTFCIRKSENPSKIIANYKSRFHFIEGKFYASEQCPDCYYYEVPDVILQP